MDTEQNDADEQLDAVADPETGPEDQSGDQAPDPGHSGEGDGKPEYFLEVDDRTRYKTQDAARQGIQESNAKLREYRDIGSPEELKAVREENARLKRSHQELVGNEPDPDSPKRKIDSLDPKVRKEWEDSRPVMEEMFDGRYMSREDFRREQDARFTARTDRALDGILQTADRNLNQFEKNRIRASAQQAMRDPNDPLGVELSQAYTADDPSNFAKLVAANMVPQEIAGAEADKPKSTQRRGADGKFRSTADREAAARLEAGAHKASQLPKAPPDGGGTAGISTEQTLVEIKPGSRIALLKQNIQTALGR